jgi:hypothetical protein
MSQNYSVNSTVIPKSEENQLLDYFHHIAKTRKSVLDSMPEALREFVLRYETITGHSYDDSLASINHEHLRRVTRENGPNFID